MIAYYYNLKINEEKQECAYKYDTINYYITKYIS